MRIDTAVYSAEGGHDINEDSFLCCADKGIFIVADGLGGHDHGEAASAAAIEYFSENCTGGYDEKRINELISGANRRVFDDGRGRSTVAAAFVENGLFRYTNVGDSRVYYFSGGHVTAISKDHSVCQAAVDMGTMSFSEIRYSDDRSKLLKVLGESDSIDPKRNYQPITICDGDAFLICSDGFWEYIYETEMEVDLLKSERAGSWLRYMLKRHILRAENSGDNYTAICGIIRLDESDAPKKKSRKR